MHYSQERPVGSRLESEHASELRERHVHPLVVGRNRGVGGEVATGIRMLDEESECAGADDGELQRRDSQSRIQGSSESKSDLLVSVVRDVLPLVEQVKRRVVVEAVLGASRLDSDRCIKGSGIPVCERPRSSCQLNGRSGGLGLYYLPKRLEGVIPLFDLPFCLCKLPLRVG